MFTLKFQTRISQDHFKIFLHHTISSGLWTDQINVRSYHVKQTVEKRWLSKTGDVMIVPFLVKCDVTVVSKSGKYNLSLIYITISILCQSSSCARMVSFTNYDAAESNIIGSVL